MHAPDPYHDPLRNVRTLLVSMVAVLLVGTAWMLFAGRSTTSGGQDALTGGPEDTTATTATTVAEGSTAATTDTGETTASTAAGTISTSATAGERVVTLPDDPLQGLAVETIASGLAQPTFAVTAPGDDRLFVVERVGRIKVIDDSGVQETSWMNITDKVLANGIEQGLLGLAFHPDYANNGRVFVYYTDKNAQRTLAEFSGNFIEGDGDSAKILFSLPQPPDSVDIRHYGGMLQFGPDGYLYVSTGDGADARGQGQNPNTFFGTILRLDVNSGDPYGIPPDNPFVDGGGAPEVFAFGLRNPWRYWIDPFDNDMYIADVGQGDVEEVNVISLDAGGYNLGWANMEGSRCFFEDNCDINDYVAPVLEYDHGESPDSGCSVTGGPVYRGAAIPELDGHYFFADWCAGWVKSFQMVDGARANDNDWRSDLGIIEQINGIGTDAEGEMIILTFGGDVLRIVPER